jgi:murein DD-endopeptidase MepM/ murein hydrolase activator NlpD
MALLGPITGNAVRIQFTRAPSVAIAVQDSTEITATEITTVKNMTAGAICLIPPVSGSITERFRAPDCPYCAGRRTIKFSAEIGQAVRAPVSGQVSFAGVVAGIGYVTITPTQAPSHLVTVGGLIGYESIRDGNVQTGDTLGYVLITGPDSTGPDSAGAAINGSVLLSVRQIHPSGQTTYLDPEPYLAYSRVRARLLPAEGLARRPVQAVFGCRTRL